MRDFFKGWMRKAGCVTLLITLAFLGGWIRSSAIGEYLGCARLGFGSIDGSFCVITGANGEWEHPSYESAAGVSNSLSALSTHYRPRWWLGGFGQLEMPDDRVMVTVAPYWSIVVPFTLVSAGLLLSKPRTRKRPPE